MWLAKVTGTVTAPQKHRHLEGKKLLVVRPLDPYGRPAGPSVLAVDDAQAGVGDIVLVNKEGSSARLIFDDAWIPVQAVVVGVVDGVELEGVGTVRIEEW